MPADKRLDFDITRMRESKGPQATAYVELNNYCQRLQRESSAATKKNAQTLATLVVWKLKAEFADGTFDFDATDPNVTIDASFVEDLVDNPPKAPRKRKIDVRGSRPSSKKGKHSAEEASSTAHTNSQK